jgi:opacity protein-like surface antigen
LYAAARGINIAEFVMQKTSRYITVAFIGALAGLNAASSALAQDTMTVAQGPYVSFAAGASQPDPSHVFVSNPTTTPGVNAKTTFDTGIAFSAALGYRWQRGLRTEAEMNYRQAEINDIAGARATGRQKVLGFMGNMLFDIDLGEDQRFRPYIGGGAGVGYNKWKHVRATESGTFPVGSPQFDDRDTVFQWQAIGGFNHAINENIDAFVEYRYIGLQNVKFYTTSPLGFSSISRHNDRSHNLMLGMRFNFG